jgi:RNA polymerase sigma factor (sigma-70 family)
MSAVAYGPDTLIGGPAGRFPSTRPSVIASATDPDPRVRRDAFQAIITAYWKPVYKYVRLQWHKGSEDAKDLTQAFFADLLTDSTLVRFDSTRASFRTYVRMCVDGFVSNDNQTAARLKRGGGHDLVPIDVDAIERELPADRGVSMDEFFHREWQREMFTLGVQDLGRLARDTGKDVAFRVFEAHDLVDDPPSYAELAHRFGLSESTVTNHLAWARRELRRFVIARVEQLAADGREFAQDVQSLFGPAR